MRLGKFGKLLHRDDTSLGVGNISRFTIIEIKYLFGIIINTFNTTSQDRYHSHAFHAWSWMLKGGYFEDVIKDGKVIRNVAIWKSRWIPRNHIHRIGYSLPGSMSVTFEGPWESTWQEYFTDGRMKTYTWGRKVLFDSKYTYLTK